MKHTFPLLVGAVLMVTLGCDEFDSGGDEGTELGPDGDGCGTNSYPSGDGVCECATGYDWCDPDGDDTNCCRIATDSPDDNGDFYPVYYEPTTDNGTWADEYLRSTEYGEGMTEIINTSFALPFDVEFAMAECDVVNAWWDPNVPQIVMCHELLADAYLAFQSWRPDLDDEYWSSAAYLVHVFVALHEFGHALQDLLSLPLTGGEEDAADQFAALMVIEAGYSDIALYGAQYFRIRDDGMTSGYELADEHGLNLQRFYDIVCLVYGSDPEGEAELLTAFPEMETRFPRCQQEYWDVSDAWNALLADHAL